MDDKSKYLENLENTIFRTPFLNKRFTAKEVSERKEGNDSQRFWNLLADINERINFIPPSGRKTQILDIACGPCEETKLLTGFFGGGSFEVNGENADFVGIDIDPDRIRQAKKSNSLQNVKFICGDATNLNQYEGIPSQADIIVICNQQISQSRDVWSKIFQQAIQRFNQGGILIITSLSDNEHFLLKETLRELPCQIVLDQQNQHSKPITENASKDKNVLVVTKKA